MKLAYYKEELNFGDALNEIIFNHYCSEILDNNTEHILLGIGTVLGLNHGYPDTKKIVVFSSGYGFGDSKTYGELPKIDKKYDIICIRGPLTAEKLNIAPSKAITDGAILLKGIPIPKEEKTYKWAFMPHHLSEKMYPKWEKLVNKAGGHFISAINKPDFVLKEIQKTELLITEAMHGAIVADTLRTPWIAVKGYKHINDFKWKDWLLSMDMELNFHYLSSMFLKPKLSDNVSIRFGFKTGSLLNKATTYLINIYQNLVKYNKNKKTLKKLSMLEGVLSDTNVLENRFQELLSRMEILKSKYSHNIKH